METHAVERRNPVTSRLAVVRDFLAAVRAELGKVTWPTRDELTTATRQAIEIKNGKKVVVERKLYPGYVLIETTMSQEAQHLVNSVQGVIKWVGTGKLPQPLRQEEVNRLLGVVEE